MSPTRAFPIPVVSLGQPGPVGLAGPGSQPDDEPLAYVEMPKDMATYRPPVLPEPEALRAQSGALAALGAAHAALLERLAGGTPAPIVLDALSDAERALVNQVLGEGEVAAQVAGPDGLQVQESVFAGVWRVLQLRDGVAVHDTIEVGPVPQGLLDAAGQAAPQPANAAPLADTMNAPSVLAELLDRAQRWRPGDPAHVVNLTLLPLSAGDSAHLDARLGRGRVVILSRGYGNCRVVDTRLAHTWRVTYFNSQDLVILDTLEIGAVPEVACAAREDLEDSAERLAEVLAWVTQS